jgi:hypothetical protein
MMGVGKNYVLKIPQPVVQNFSSMAPQPLGKNFSSMATQCNSNKPQPVGKKYSQCPQQASIGTNSCDVNSFCYNKIIFITNFI